MNARSIAERAASLPSSVAAGKWFESTFAALTVRDFRYLWMGSFATQIGVWLQQVAQGWLAYDLTGSATYLGVVGIARGIPSLVLTLPGGVIADRWDRQKIMIASQLFSMLNAIALAWLVASGSIQPWHLLITAMVGGATQSLNQPSRQSLAPQLAGERHLANAIALNSISFSTSRVLGPALAGILIGFFGLAACFIVQAAGFVWATVWTLQIRRASGARQQRQQGSMWANLVAGLAYMKGSSVITGLMSIAAVPIVLGMVYQQLMPVFARDVLELNASGLGMLMSAVGVGSMIGSFAAAALSRHPRKGLILIGSGACFGLSLILFSSSRWVSFSLVALALLGGSQAITQAMNQTLLMMVTPDEYRGRVMSVFMLTWGISPLVFLPAGWLTDRVGAPITILVSGLLVVSTILFIGARQAEIRRFRDQATAEPRPPGRWGVRSYSAD